MVKRLSVDVTPHTSSTRILYPVTSIAVLSIIPMEQMGHWIASVSQHFHGIVHLRDAIRIVLPSRDPLSSMVNVHVSLATRGSRLRLSVFSTALECVMPTPLLPNHRILHVFALALMLGILLLTAVRSTALWFPTRTRLSSEPAPAVASAATAGSLAI